MLVKCLGPQLAWHVFFFACGKAPLLLVCSSGYMYINIFVCGVHAWVVRGSVESLYHFLVTRLWVHSHTTSTRLLANGYISYAVLVREQVTGLS